MKFEIKQLLTVHEAIQRHQREKAAQDSSGLRRVCFRPNYIDTTFSSPRGLSIFVVHSGLSPLRIPFFRLAPVHMRRYFLHSQHGCVNFDSAFHSPFL